VLTFVPMKVPSFIVIIGPRGYQCVDCHWSCK
jgi:hypothetical protein